MVALLGFCSMGWSTERLETLIESEEIACRVREVANHLNAEYRDEHLTIVMVMKGAVCITADLIRHLDIPFALEYVKASSYGQRGMRPEQVSISGIDDLDIASKHVLVVDDIFDTGNTLEGIILQLQKKHPKSLKSLVLLVKDVPRTTSYSPDYTLFHIGNRFVIGYGLDYKEHYRGLPAICAFINDTPPPD